MKHIINLGEILIDVIPTTQVRLGETCYTPYPGGAIANVAVAIARLGGSSRFIGGVSEDEFGRLLMQVLADNHVDAQFVQVVKGAPTAIAMVTLQAAGQRHFTFFRQGTADSQLQAESLNWSAWHDAAICHVGGVLLSTEPARSATFAAMEHTRRAGSIVSFDVNVRPTLWTFPTEIRDTIAQAVERTDILKLSVEEDEFVSEQGSSLNEPLLEGDRLNRLGDALLERGPRLVIITLGAHGALLLTARRRVKIPPLQVRSVDTTGAGDAFMGAVLYSLERQGCYVPSDLEAMSEHDLSSVGGFANTVAGLSVTRYGGISSFPFMHEVTAFRPLE
ncbi:MAG TPA: carbohydrate kinase [Ktedonobacteraceae bacterium]|nr:carbohydrate kinase [Ktedonobacteraceae bacterium]